MDELQIALSEEDLSVMESDSTSADEPAAESTADVEGASYEDELSAEDDIIND